MERRTMMRKIVVQRASVVLLIFALIFTVIPFADSFDAHAASPAVPTQKQVYKKLISMKSKYPDGKSWNDMENTYSNDYGSGSGCYAFALLMSDAAFGKKLPYTEHKNLSELKVGDIVHVNNGGHYVIVLKKQKKYITVAEGNWGGRIRWNRKISVSSLKKDKRLSILTRYYWKGFDVNETAESVKLTWPKLTKAQQKKIDGIAVIRSGKVIKMLDKTATSYTDTDLRVGSMNFYKLKTYKKTNKKITKYWNKKTGKWQKKKIKNAKTKKFRKKYEYSHETPTKDVFFMGDGDNED